MDRRGFLKKAAFGAAAGAVAASGAALMPVKIAPGQVKELEEIPEKVKLAERRIRAFTLTDESLMGFRLMLPTDRGTYEGPLVDRVERSPDRLVFIFELPAWSEALRHKLSGAIVLDERGQRLSGDPDYTPLWLTPGWSTTFRYALDLEIDRVKRPELTGNDIDSRRLP